MRHWPWFTIFVALGLAFSSPGRSLIEQALVAGDPLVQNAAKPAFYRAVGIVLVAGIVEYLVKRWLHQRKAER